ncbi:unnamed protein product, partial [Porites lobata]
MRNGENQKISQEDILKEQLNATVDVEEIRKGSQIYGKAGVSDTLTSYQRAINQAAFELCSANPVLLKHKGDLLQAARK